jgi:hypothetical protein
MRAFAGKSAWKFRIHGIGGYIRIGSSEACRRLTDPIISGAFNERGSYTNAATSGELNSPAPGHGCDLKHAAKHVVGSRIPSWATDVLHRRNGSVNGAALPTGEFIDSCLDEPKYLKTRISTATGRATGTHAPS